jgi:hypothetical protein
LPAFERHTSDLRVECGRITNGGVSIDHILAGLGKHALDERVACARCRRGRRRFAAVSGGKKARKGVFERALGRR